MREALLVRYMAQKKKRPDRFVGGPGEVSFGGGPKVNLNAASTPKTKPRQAKKGGGKA